MRSEMETSYISVDDLVPYARNAKKHGRKQIDNVAQSISEFGMVQPIVVDKDNNVIIGHCRLLACKKLGIKEVPVVKLEDLTPEQANKLRLLDNKLNESDWDFELLMDDIPEIDFTGYDVDWHIHDVKEQNQMKNASIPDEVDAKVELDQVWQLGNHLLICGDSTKEETFAKIMDQKAKILFTSPPYSDLREYNGGKDLEVSNLCNFIKACRPFTDYQCVNLGIQRKDSDIVEYWNDYIHMAREVGYKLMAWNVWDKEMCGSIGQANAFFPIRHEWIFVFGTEFFEINLTMEKKPDSIKKNSKLKTIRNPDGTAKYHTTGDTSQPYKQMESVLQMLPVLDNNIRKLHPATFPVELPAEYIKAMTNEGDLVIEPFGGSGTTLIACEQLNRKCRIVELDPHYCDIIISRWENLTGKKGVLLNG